MKEYYSALLEGISEYRELGQQVADAIQDEFDSWNEDFEKKANNIEHLTDVVEGYQNVIDILG
jgi:hypothetical protein